MRTIDHNVSILSTPYLHKEEEAPDRAAGLELRTFDLTVIDRLVSHDTC